MKFAKSVKNGGARVLTTSLPLLVYGNFFRRSRAANSAVRGRIGPYYEFNRYFMVVLLTCKISISPLVLEIFMFEIVNGRTDGRRPESYHISSHCEPLAQVTLNICK